MYKIIVNGNETEFDKDTISYEDIINMVATRRTKHSLYTVTFNHKMIRSIGCLTRGESTDVYDGMWINATIT